MTIWTRPSGLADFVRAATTGLGRAMTAGEIRKAYAAAHGGDTKYIGVHVCALATQEILGCHRGRRRNSLYWHTDFPVPVIVQDPAVAVAAAVRWLCEQRGRYCTGREVCKKLREDGHGFTSTKISQLLLLLSQRPDTRPDGSPDPLAITLTRVAGTGVKNAVLYAPRSAPPTADPNRIPASSAIEALRKAAEYTAICLGRPPEGREIAWCADHAVRARARGDQVPEYLLQVAESDLTRAHRVVLRHDRENPDTQGVLHVHRSKQANNGGARTRARLSPPTVEEIAHCNFKDALGVYRPADEMSSLTILERRAQMEQSATLNSWILLRRETLSSVIYSDIPSHITLDEVVADIRSSLRTLRGWMAGTARPASYVGAQEREHVDLERQLSVLHRISPPPASAVRQVAVIGERAGMAMDSSLAWWTSQVSALHGYGPRADGRPRYDLLARVRRVPKVGARRDEAGGLLVQLLRSHELDRVDAFIELFRHCPHIPRTQALLGNAERLLGGVIRDAGRLLELLHALPVREHVTRRAVVVASGLLGVALPRDEALGPDATSRDAAAAVLAALLAAPEGGAEVIERIAELNRLAKGGAKDVTSMALRRAERDRWLMLVE